jgi:hypothetical protein
MTEEENDFADTMTRVSSIDKAKIEKYREEHRKQRREPWFRRAEDREAAIEAKRKQRRDELQKWVILAMLFVSLLVGDSTVFQILKGMIGG